MTRGKDTPTVKEIETSKTRKGKAKADRKGTNLNTKTSLWCKLKDVKKMNSSIVATLGQLNPSLLLEFPLSPLTIRNYDPYFSDDDLKDLDGSVASLLIVQVSNTKKEKESRDIEECLQKIDSLFNDGIFADQEDTTVEKEVAIAEEEVVAEEEKVSKNEKE
ncbi:hypothetical protein J1N35_025779 [Gossypium stocksii]|uniref:Uncharacterized protein n=1 Tax=Gossypium stocksii TaxID=47602 RepID=A0A9D3V705_9ROSI|nr:hypothetical protein J1N35_025779 [Gossypium stocksii]